MILSDWPNLTCSPRRAEFIEELSIDLFKLAPLLRNIIFVIDGLNRADWLAGATVHTLIGLDVEHPITFIDAVDGTLLDTGLVLDVDTRKRDHICHKNLLTRKPSLIVHNSRG